MQISDFFIVLGKALEEMQKPMLIEEAVDIIDPYKNHDFEEDENIRLVKELKATRIVVAYVCKRNAT